MRGQLLARNTTVTARAQLAGACLKFLEISQNLSKWPIPTRHIYKRAKALKIVPQEKF